MNQLFTRAERCWSPSFCASVPLPVGVVCSILLSNNTEQRSASPVSYISTEHPNPVLAQGGSASAGRGWSPDCTIPSVLQQRGGDKLLKGLGYCKLASSLGKGQLGLSKHILHPLLPSSVLPAFSPCGDAMN